MNLSFQCTGLRGAKLICGLVCRSSVGWNKYESCRQIDPDFI